MALPSLTHSIATCATTNTYRPLTWIAISMCCASHIQHLIHACISIFCSNDGRCCVFPSAAELPYFDDPPMLASTLELHLEECPLSFRNQFGCRTHLAMTRPDVKDEKQVNVASQEYGLKGDRRPRRSVPQATFKQLLTEHMRQDCGYRPVDTKSNFYEWDRLEPRLRIALTWIAILMCCASHIQQLIHACISILQ